MREFFLGVTLVALGFELISFVDVLRLIAKPQGFVALPKAQRR